MASAVQDLLKAATTAAQNQQAARTAAQSTAAAIASQRGSAPRTAPVPADAQAAGPGGQ